MAFQGGVEIGAVMHLTRHEWWYEEKMALVMSQYAGYLHGIANISSFFVTLCELCRLVGAECCGQ